jgi:hypothetical protein
MSVGLLFGAPTIVLWLLSYILSDTPGAFNNWGAYILALFPLIFMFLITSIATLRENKWNARKVNVSASWEV